MGSILGNWPSHDPHNFSQLRPSDPSSPSALSRSASLIDHTTLSKEKAPRTLRLSSRYIPHSPNKIMDISKKEPYPCPTCISHFNMKMEPATYHPTHSRTLPPPDQVITTETRNILLRHIYQQAEEKLKPKRAASDNLLPEHGRKQPRFSTDHLH